MAFIAMPAAPSCSWICGGGCSTISPYGISGSTGRVPPSAAPVDGVGADAVVVAAVDARAAGWGGACGRRARRPPGAGAGSGGGVRDVLLLTKGSASGSSGACLVGRS
ncbi:MAG: hypothetical protein CMH83_10895 [Nocardioides sp.]|nr:hypothetical protein [Nocardioides sp.]